MDDLGSTILTALQSEFSDINDVGEGVKIVVRLLVASILGGLIGYERESKGKSAGLRTHMLVALGSALFVLAPALSEMAVADMSRVLQGIIAGIGFLGAGAIIKSRGSNDVKGLTTAASIWLTAAVGITAGLGREMLALVSTLFALFILAMLRNVEARIERDNAIEARQEARREADDPAGAIDPGAAAGRAGSGQVADPLDSDARSERETDGWDRQRP